MKYVMLSLGVLAGIPLIWRQREPLGLKNPWQAILLCLGFSAGSTLSAMLFASLEGLLSGNGFRFGAISTYGVYFFFPPTVWFAAKAVKRNGWRWLDMFAVYALPSLFLMRCNCLRSGCCGGSPIGSTGLRWPTRQVEMIFYAIMLLVLLRREEAGARSGTAFPLLAGAYGAFRFIEEWFRDYSGESLIHLAHIWSLMAIIIGFGLYFELNSGWTQASGPRKEKRVSKY